MRLEEKEFNAKDVREVTEQDLRWATENMGIQDHVYGHTLCDMVRQIYEITEKEEVKKRCLIIFCYAKRMNAKLTKYAMGKEIHG